MKNNFLTRNSKKYIFKYSIEDDRIVVYHSLGKKGLIGKKSIIPYTPENEKRILKIMSSQIASSDRWKMNSLARFGFVIFGLMAIVTIVGTICSTIIVTVKNISPLSMFGSTTIGFAMGAATFSYGVIKFKREIIDYEKNRKFGVNEEELGRTFELSPNILQGVSPKTKEFFSTKDTFTINDLVDIVGYDNFMKILDNLEREQFGFDYSNSQGKEPIEGQIDIDYYISQSEKPSEEQINSDHSKSQVAVPSEEQFGFDYSNSQGEVVAPNNSQGAEPIEGQIDIDYYISQGEKPMVLRRKK